MSSEAITRNDLKNVINSLLPIFYPVGSYYETSETTFDPNTEWGGTWELEVAGQVHVSSGTVSGTNTSYVVNGALTNESDGGNKDAIIPYHRHSIASVNISSSGTHEHHGARRPINTTGGTSLMYVGPGTSTSDVQDAVVTKTDGGHTHSVPSHNTNYEPSSDNRTNANMQPFIVINRWHRIA